MKYLVHWKLPQAEYSPSAAAFLETGAIPPPGLDFVGRWGGGGEGYAVAESDDAAELERYRERWSDLLDLEITPYEDEATPSH